MVSKLGKPRSNATFCDNLSGIAPYIKRQILVALSIDVFNLAPSLGLSFSSCSTDLGNIINLYKYQNTIN